MRGIVASPVEEEDERERWEKKTNPWHVFPRDDGNKMNYFTFTVFDL